jgi:hypothetical protein
MLLHLDFKDSIYAWFSGRDEYAASHANLIEESKSKLFTGDDDWSLKP